tara:strand:+ start:4148 stop:4669 length:522 start_codon:yes stop_codon:yes gene_type:complete
MAPVAIAATAASAVIGAAGAAQAAAAAKATGEANKVGFERAAKVVEQQKDIVDASAANELFKFNRAFKINQAQSTAAYLKGGVTLEGTPEDVLANNAYLANYERKILDYNTAVQKKKLDDDAAQLRYSGEIKSAEGQMLANSYRMKAVGSIIGGVAGVSQMTTTYYPTLLGGN